MTRTAPVTLAPCVGMLLLACRQEFVAGVIELDDAAGTTVVVDPSSSGDATTGTDGGSTAGTGVASSDSSDGSTTFIETTGPLPECEAPMGHSTCDADGDPMHTLGLGCPSQPTDSTQVSAVQFVSAADDAWRSCREYGNATFNPKEGNKLLLLTTGTLPAPDGSDQVTVPLGQTWAANGGNANPDGVALPAPIDPSSGSDGTPFSGCDGVGDCSDSLADPWAAGGPANDLVWLTFEVDVPPGTFGWRADLAFFSAEFPRQVGEVNDIVVWWQSSEAFTGNVATLDGAPLSVTGIADFLVATGKVGNAADLQGTGFAGTEGTSCSFDGGAYAMCPRGATTGWVEIDGPAQPGETFQTTIALFDLGDDDLDTTIVLDNWRWNCPGCVPGASCGVHRP